MRPRVPQRFLMIREGSRTIVIRPEVHAALGPLLLSAWRGTLPGGEMLAGGRGAARRLTLAGGDVIVVRFYRRGGAVARILGERYWGLRPRPFLELATTEEARRRGVPVPEVLGAGVERLAGGWYRGLLVTRYLSGTRTLWQCWQEAREEALRQTLARSAGVSLRRLCEAGIYHPDLNLSNCLVRFDERSVSISIVDLDRARVMGPGLAAAMRRRMLRRFERSARKLDPGGRVVRPDDLRLVRKICLTRA